MKELSSLFWFGLLACGFGLPMVTYTGGARGRSFFRNLGFLLVGLGVTLLMLEIR